jgi:hypothetical protein
VNWSELEMLEVPSGVVTVISTAPSDCVGDVTVIDESLFTVTSVPATEPNITAVAPVSPVPLTVTTVPPSADPEEGLTPETVGIAPVVVVVVAPVVVVVVAPVVVVVAPVVVVVAPVVVVVAPVVVVVAPVVVVEDGAVSLLKRITTVEMSLLRSP